MTTTTNDQLEGLGTYKFGWADSDVAGASARRGLSEEVVRDISARKNEPEWMLDMRLKGLKYYGRKPMPTWGADLSGIDYHKIREDLEEKGVLFLDTDTALREQPDMFREYFGTVIPPGDNKFAALNTAVWSGGSFMYVPKGVHVEIPLQAYFRITTE